MAVSDRRGKVASGVERKRDETERDGYEGDFHGASSYDIGRNGQNQLKRCVGGYGAE